MKKKNTKIEVMNISETSEVENSSDTLDSKSFQKS